ncbi:unknown [Prevotella sp. CAG:1058]|nr:unknown [Prevotella sp. CAG:1058]
MFGLTVVLNLGVLTYKNINKKAKVVKLILFNG